MRQAATQELFTYWDRLRAGRAAPERAEIDPAAIRNVLADTFLIEIDASCTFPIRLSGTRLNALWLLDQKGRSFVDLWAEDERRGVAALMLTVIEGVNPVVAGVTAAPRHRTPMNMELLLLPLRHNGKTHARVLGCITPSAQEPWFGLVAVDTLRLRSTRVIRPAELSGSLAFRDRREQAPAPQLLAKRGHLTLLAGGIARDSPGGP